MGNKLSRFHLYPETEVACKYKTPLYKTEYLEILVEYEKRFDMITGKLIIISTHTKSYRIITIEQYLLWLNSH